jgi:alpha-beta hydrolase superfamily lysophospholipase
MRTRGDTRSRVGRARDGMRAAAGAGALAVALAVTMVTPAAASSRAERVDAAAPSFYRPPAQLEAGAAPGTVVRTAPYDAIPGARAWKVLYHSQALDGRDVVVSGVVVAPTSGEVPDGGRPVVSWAHGTHGIADKCAPSRHDDWVRRMPAIKDLISRGYVVAATDYEGLGTPGVHPYLVGESGARGALDVVRAAQQIPQTKASDETVVFGHSQGGQAALFAGEIAPEYAPDLDLKGVVAGAPAAEIEAMLPAAASLPDTLGFVVMGLAGAEAVYPDADRAQVLTAAGLEQSDIIGTKCYGEVLKAFRKPVDQVIANNPSDVAPWPEIMARSTAGQRPTQVPLFVFQGMGDDIVYKVFTDMYVERSCTTGNTVLYRTYDGVDHYGEVEASETDIVDWIDARVSGEPAPSTCAAPA